MSSANVTRYVPIPFTVHFDECQCRWSKMTEFYRLIFLSVSASKRPKAMNNCQMNFPTDNILYRMHFLHQSFVINSTIEVTPTSRNEIRPIRAKTRIGGGISHLIFLSDQFRYLRGKLYSSSCSHTEFVSWTIIGSTKIINGTLCPELSVIQTRTNIFIIQ